MIGLWCNGSTRHFGRLSLGSNPSSPTNLILILIIMEKTELTKEQRKAKRIARNKIARDIMLILVERENVLDNTAAKILSGTAVALANAFVDEIENNVI